MLSILLISDIQPADTSGGQVVLYRHLKDLDARAPTIVWDSMRPQDVIRRVAGWLEKLGLGSSATMLHHVNAARYLDRHALDAARRCDLVLTVAHGTAFMAAMRLAKQFNKPLVTFFHDWWPDLVETHGSTRRRIEDAFRELYQASDLALCVSEGMKKQLGPHPNSHVLYPIPSKVDRCFPETSQSSNESFKVYYAGNLNAYGPMLADLLQVAKNFPGIRIEVRGTNPRWPKSLQEEMQSTGNWLPFVGREELERWLSTADAFLIPQTFKPSQRRMMETNFPSKIPEMSQWGRPLIVWGPTYASGTLWARQQRAIAVTDPSALVVAEKLCHLAKDLEARKVFGGRAYQAATHDLHIDHIQDKFLTELTKLNTSNRRLHESDL